MLTAPWRAAPDHLVALPPRDAVHIWRLDLERPARDDAHMYRLLSADECARAAQFRFERDRSRFLASHGLLRIVLSRYLDQPPERLRFAYGSHGKPELAASDVEASSGGDTRDVRHVREMRLSQRRTAPGLISRDQVHGYARATATIKSHVERTMIRFNLTHSEGLALLAVACGREVGIDLERVRDDFAFEAIVERYFSTQERAAMARIPPSRRRDAFYTCWTRKEAYVKARSDGLSLEPATFTVALARDAQPTLLAVANQPHELRRWELFDVDAGVGYAASLAVEGKTRDLRLWEA